MLTIPILFSMIEQISEWIKFGGPVLIILVCMSVIALTIILAKLWQFQSIQLSRLKPIRQALDLHLAGKSDKALALIQGSRNPAAATLAQAIRGKIRQLPDVIIREEIERYSDDVLESLHGGFRLLEMIASLAPLLGLLGTVLGMIEAFRQLELSGSNIDPASLSGGIWEALLTTAAGLTVAIPVVAILNRLEHRVDRFARMMTSLVTRVFTQDLSADWFDRSGSPAQVMSPQPEQHLGAMPPEELAASYQQGASREAIRSQGQKDSTDP